MNKISAISSNKVNTYVSIPFKGTEKKEEEDKSEKIGTGNYAKAKEALGRADIRLSAARPAATKKGVIAAKFSDGLMRKTFDGSLYTGTIVSKGDAYTKKQVKEYKDGRLSRVVKYSHGEPEKEDTIYEFSYPKKNATCIDVLKYNDLVDDFTLWDRVTMTPDIVAKHHIGKYETSDSTLTVKDRKTGKKLSETNFSTNYMSEEEKLPPEFEKDFAYLTERFKPKEKFEYHSNGTMKKKIGFDETLKRIETSYDDKGNKTSIFAYDKFNRPYDIYYYGVTEEPVLLSKSQEKQKIPYELQIKFLTNYTSDSLASFDKRQPQQIVSSGKVSQIDLFLKPKEGTTKYTLENWFWDNATVEIINIQQPSNNGSKKTDPSVTAMKTFNDLAREYEGKLAHPNKDLSEFLEDYENRISVRQYLRGEDKSRNIYYYVDKNSGDLYFTDEKLDKDMQQQTNKLYHKLNDLVLKYSELPKKPAE